MNSEFLSMNGEAGVVLRRILAEDKCGLCSCDYDEEGELQPNGEAKFKCGDGYYCRLCAEYDNDVLVSGEHAYCTECLAWIPLTKFVQQGKVELAQPCRQCRKCV